MTTSVVTDMNLGGSKQSVNGGRRKTKSESAQKKNKLPRRGMGVEQLERIISQDNWKKITETPSYHHRHHHHHLLPPCIPSVGFTTSGFSAVANAGVHYRHVPTPVNWIHGANMYSVDRGMDPPVIGSSNGGFRFENSKELSSVPSYVKCASDRCGVCHKKKRINRGSFCGNNTVGEMMDAGKTRRSSGQVTPSASSLTEYHEFFPGNCGGSMTTAWCGSGSSVAGGLGFRGGEGSCVTAITGGEEGSVSSVDLSLKLSY